MPRVLVKLDASGEQKSFPITFDHSINVGELIPLVFNTSGLKANDYTIDSVLVFVKETNNYVKVNDNFSVENLQKFEINLTKKDYSETKVLVLLNDGTQETLFLNNANVENLNQLTAKVIEKLSLKEAEAIVKKIDMYEDEFEEYIDLPNPSFFEKKQSYRYILHYPKQSSSGSSKSSQSVANLKPVSCGFQDGPTELNFTKAEVITRQALGRIAALGELYDAHKDTFCSHSIFCNSVEKFITQIDTQKTDLEEIFEDSINAKFKKFEVEAELKASFLSGMISASGNGKYLSSSMTNTKESSASLVCRMLTKHQKLHISNRTLLSDLSLDAIKNTPSATHVVTAIQWGAGATAELLYKHQDNESKDQIKASLKFAFKKIAWSVEGSGEGEHNDTCSDKSESFRLKFYVDALPNGENIPQTVEEARNFIKQLPKLIEKANGGKGVPLVYTLTPLCSFKSYLKEMEFYDRIIHKVDESIIEEIVQLFDEITKSYRKVDNIYTEFVEYNYCLRDEILQSIALKLNALKKAQTDLRKELHQTLVEVRYGRKNANALSEVLQKYQNSNLMPTNINTFCYTLVPCMEKIAYAQCLLKKNVIYVGKETSLEVERIRHDLKEYFGYFCDWRDEKYRAENSDLFVDLVGKDLKLLFIDVEVNPGIKNNVNIPDGNRICHYLNRKYIDTDYLQSWKNDRSKCFAKCTSQRKSVPNKYCKLITAIMPCPQSFKGKYCSKEEYKWLCHDCEEILQYDCDNSFFCKCGMAPVATFEFQCSHDRHGGEYICFDKRQLQRFDKQPHKILTQKLQPPKEINILILGERNGGKSTMINSLANYFAYSSFSEALASPLICPISVPVHFPVNDETIQRTFIDEPINDGSRKPSTHVFNVHGNIIRFIDTPGIDFFKGSASEEFTSIFEHISNYKELHGICILMNSSSSCFKFKLKYCINEILVRFHKNAAPNILFCFTNCGSMAGNAIKWQVVNDYIKEHDETSFLSEKTKYFYFENEAFNYLNMAHHLGINVDELYDKYYIECSWNMSQKEIYRLLNHLENNIKPHRVEDTIAVNEAKGVIFSYSKAVSSGATSCADKTKISQITEVIEKCEAYLKANAFLIYDGGMKDESVHFRKIASKSYGSNVVTASEILNLRKEYDRIMKDILANKDARNPTSSENEFTPLIPSIFYGFEVHLAGVPNNFPNE